MRLQHFDDTWHLVRMITVSSIASPGRAADLLVPKIRCFSNTGRNAHPSSDLTRQMVTNVSPAE